MKNKMKEEDKKKIIEKLRFIAWPIPSFDELKDATDEQYAWFSKGGIAMWKVVKGRLLKIMNEIKDDK